MATYADPTPCTLERRCSSTGKVCGTDDRACQSDATNRGLEITCERTLPSSHDYLYCPPGASSRDGNVVWILLAVAFAIAAMGGAGAYFVFRKER